MRRIAESGCEMGRVALRAFGLPCELARPARMAHVPSKAARPKDVSLETGLVRALESMGRDLRAGFASMGRTRSW